MAKPDMKADIALFAIKVTNLHEDAEHIRDNITDTGARNTWDSIAGEAEWMLGKVVEFEKAQEDNT